MSFNIGDKELVRWYYCGILSSDATRQRRLGGEGKLGDKYIFVPKVCAMDRCLNSGSIEDFFRNSEVCSMGINKDGFDEFVERLKRNADDYDERRFLEL